MEISKFAKMAFLVDGLVAVIYGLIMLLIPDIHATVQSFPYEEFADRYIGALFIGYGIGNILAYRSSMWETVELVVIMNITFLILGLIVGLYCIAIAVLPINGLLQMGLMIFLLLLFLYAWYEAKMKGS